MDTPSQLMACQHYPLTTCLLNELQRSCANKSSLMTPCQIFPVFLKTRSTCKKKFGAYENMGPPWEGPFLKVIPSDQRIAWFRKRLNSGQYFCVSPGRSLRAASSQQWAAAVRCVTGHFRVSTSCLTDEQPLGVRPPLHNAPSTSTTPPPLISLPSHIPPRIL